MQTYKLLVCKSITQERIHKFPLSITIINYVAVAQIFATDYSKINFNIILPSPPYLLNDLFS